MAPNGRYKISIEHRVTCLEEKLVAFRDDLIEIKDNHLVHLKDDIERLDTRTWLILSGIIVGIGIQILFKLF